MFSKYSEHDKGWFIDMWLFHNSSIVADYDLVITMH